MANGVKDKYLKKEEETSGFRKDNQFLESREETEGTEGEGEAGKGGKGGQVEFREFIGSGELLRDDLLTGEEKKRLLSVHNDTHERRVKEQKEKRDQRQDLKNGKIPLDTYHRGLMGGVNSQYKVNPILANKAQFSGIDRQVNSLPTENVSETNNEKREELDYQYRLRYMPENAPRFNPKPQYH